MPNGLSDGAVIIDTGLNNSGLIRDEGQFKRAVESMTQAVHKSGQQMGKSMEGYLKALQQAGSGAQGAAKGQSALEKEIARTEAAIARQEERLEVARRKFEAAQMDAIAEATEKARAQTEGMEFLPWENPDKAMEQVSEAINQAAREAEEAFGTFEESTTFRNLSVGAEYLYEKLEGLKAQLASVREEAQADGEEETPAYIKAWGQMPTLSGMVQGAFQRIADAANTARLAMTFPGQAADRLGASLVRIAGTAGNAAISFLKKLAVGAKNAAIQLAKLAGRAVVNGLKKIGQLAGGAAKKLFGLGKGARQSGDGFKHSLKNLMRYGLGIRSLFFLFNRLRSAIKEGFEALAEYDPRVKAALASLKGALGGLKGSLSAAFAPILTAVAPALTTFINMVTKAVNAIGMFFAALTGQSYYNAAKGVEAIGDAAGSAGGSVKELKRQLAGFDELNILTKNDGGGSGSGAGGSSAGFEFEKMDVSGGIADFAKKLKELFANGKYEEIGKIIADGINGALKKAEGFISWNNIGGTITKALNVVTGAINGFTWNFNWKGLGTAIGTGVNTIATALKKFYTDVDWESIGTGIGDSINGLINSIDWANLGEAFRAKAKAILDVLVGALTTIDFGNAGTKLAEALNAFFDDPELWKKAGTAISKALGGLLNFGSKLIGSIHWGNAGRDFASALNTFFKDTNLWKNAGATINNALLGLLDFTKNFFITFDPDKAAESIRTALAQIQWGEIADSMWETAAKAFDKAADFVVTLLGGDTKLEDKFKTGKDSPVFRIAKAIGKAIGDIDWPAILEAGKQAFLDAFDGLLSGLFDSENGDVALKIAAAIAGIKLAPTLLKGALLKMLAGSGVAGAGAGSAIGGAASGISGGLAGLIGGGLNLAGLYGFGKSAVVNGKNLYDIVKEWVDEGHGSFWDLLKGSVHDLFSGDDGKGFLDHARETINTLFDPLKPEGNFLKSVVDKWFPSGKDSLFDTDSESLGDKIFSALGIPIGGNDGKGKKIDYSSLFRYEERGKGIYDPKNDRRERPEQEKDKSAEKGKGDVFGADLLKHGIKLNSDPDMLNQMGNLEASSKVLNGSVKKSVEATDNNTKAKTEDKLGEKQKTLGIGIEWEKTDLNPMENLTVSANVDFKPAGAGAAYTNRPLSWLQKLFAPGTDTQNRVELVKKIANQTPATLFGTAFDAFATLLKKNKGDSSGSLFGTAFTTLASLAKKVKTASSGGLFGTAFTTFATLAKKNPKGSTQSSGGLFGTAFNTFASLYKKVQSDSSGGLFGTAFNTFASLLKQDKNASSGGLFGTAFTAAAKLAKQNKNDSPSSLFGTTFTSYTELKKKAGSLPYVAAQGGRNALYDSEFESYTDLNKGPFSANSPGDLFGTTFDSYSRLNKENSDQTTAKLFGERFTATANLNLNIETKQVNVDLKLNEISKKAAGGIITAAGRSLAFATGGMISAGSRASWWSSATKYASGTSRAHGTVFVAGEAGPEIVGHVNGRTEILNKSQLAQTMYSAVTGGMIAALRGITFTVPAMATGGIMPYEVSAQIARTGEDIRNTLNANNEDLIQTIISVAGQLVAAVGRIQNNQTGAGGATAQQVIDEINRRTLMFGASPLKGV